MFERYVNPKIEQLKGTIIPIRYELNTIDGIISSLSKTKNSIELSQGGIHTSIEAMKISIESRKTFNRLVSSIVEELNKMKNELNELNKVEGIKSKLEKMYQSVKSEAQRKLCEIKQKFESHETEFRKKLCSYVGKIKSNLKTLHEDPKPMIGELKTKIKALVGEKNGCRYKTGKLVDLENEIRGAKIKFDSYSTVRFMKSGRIGGQDFKKVLEVERKVREFVRYAFGYLESVYETQRRLCNVLDTLNEKTDFGRIISEINGFTRVNIDTYEKKIKEHEAKVHLLNLLTVQKKPYEDSLKETTKGQKKEKGLKDVTNFIKELKLCVEKNKQHLDETFVKEVTEIIEIEDSELDQITTDIQGIIEMVDLIQNYIYNTRLFFRYLKVFKEHKSQIEGLNIEGNVISEIQDTIESIEASIGTITGTQTPIHDAKRKLEDYKETWVSGRNRKTEMEGIKRQYFPDDFRVLAELGQIQGLKTKLEAIRSLNENIPESFMSSLIFLIEPRTETRIDRLLSSLGQIGCWLEKSGYISHDIQKILDSYELNKSKLNGTQNGNGIQSYVEDIKQIPKKIAELQISVKFYIQLTQIISRVIGTLDNMKPKSVELKETNNTLEKIKETIPMIERELRSAEHNIIYMSYIGHGINIFRLKRYIHKLKEYVKSLDGDIASLKEQRKTIESYVTDLQSVQRKLSDMSTRIQYRILTLMAAPFVVYLKLYLKEDIRLEWIMKIIGQLMPIITCLYEILSTINCLKEHINKILSPAGESCRKVCTFIESVEPKLCNIKENIEKVEMSIESVIICFLKCSNKRITENTIESTKRMLTIGGQVSNNELTKPLLRCLENICWQYNI